MASKTIAYLVHPHAEIEEIKVEVDGGIVWGPSDDEHGQIAWLTPSTIFHTAKTSFMLTSIHHLSPIMIPGVEPIEAGLETLSRVFREQFQKRLTQANNADPLKGRMLFMIAGIILAIGLVATLLMSNLSGVIERFF